MNVFVTGGSGFVGRNFVEFMSQHHSDIRLSCLLRDPAKAQWMEKYPQVTQVHGNLLSPESYEKALAQADVIVHAAALVGLKNGNEFYKANTDATRHLIHAARNMKQLERLLFVSTISAIDRPLDQTAIGPMNEATQPHPNTDYGKSKLQAEQLIQASDLPYTILRPSYIYGPHPRRASSMDRIIYDVREGRPYTRIPFPGRASEIYVQDLAELMWHSACHPAARNEVFFASAPEPAMVAEVYPKIASALGINYQARRVTPMAMERFREYTYRKYPAQPLARVMFEDSFYCSSRKLFDLLGWQANTTLSDGIAKTIGWYWAQGYLDSPLVKNPTTNPAR